MNDDRIKIKFNNILRLFLSISAILALSPYFIWENYSALSNVLAKGFLVLTLFISCFYLFFIQKRVRKEDIAVAISLLLFFLFTKAHTWDGSFGWNLGTVVVLGMLVVYLLLQEEDKNAIFKIFLFLFAILLIPGIVVAICSMIGIDLNYAILESEHSGKASAGYYYRQYFLALVIDNLNYGGEINNRLCAVFDEPGVVGTISALLLVGSKYEIKGDFKNKVLLVGGILSFSLAFYIVTLCYFMLNCKEKFFTKKNILLGVVFVLIIFFTINIAIKLDNNIVNTYIVVKFNNFIHGIDNRTTVDYNLNFANYLDTTDIIIGKGEGAKKNDEIMMGASSYKDLIYDYGIIGFLYYMVWIIGFGLLKSGKDKAGQILLLLFCFSMYQRPNVLALPYMIILFGGIIHLSKKNDINKNVA